MIAEDTPQDIADFVTELHANWLMTKGPSQGAMFCSIGERVSSGAILHGLRWGSERLEADVDLRGLATSQSDC